MISNFEIKNKFQHSSEAIKKNTIQLRSELAILYDYSEFMIKIYLDIFSSLEALKAFEINAKSRPITIRANTIKITRNHLISLLINRGLKIDTIGEWSKSGLIIYDSKASLRETPEYLAGFYIIQVASAFIPCIAMKPRVNEIIVDMTVSPGVKTTYFAAQMQNQGIIIGNVINKQKLKYVMSNIQRMGVTNTIICNYDGVDLSRFIGRNFVDKVMLDCPCSGTGVVFRDPRIRFFKRRNNLWKYSNLQKQLLLDAIDMINMKSKTGGFVVYSTCSLTIEENENVIQYAIQKRNIRIVPLCLEFGRPGFTKYKGYRYHPSIENSRRFYPHIHNIDGTFICKIKKLSNKVSY